MRTTTRGRQKSDQLLQSIGVPACRPSGALDFSRRRLALVVHFLIALEAGKCAAATCTLDGKTISSSVTNSVQCNINGILTVGAPDGQLTNDIAGVLNVNDTLINSGTLINDGLITNNGFITSTGRITGTGTLNNAGIFVVASGKADIAESQNLSGGTLTGGTWEVGSTTGSETKLGTGAALVVGSGDITTNDAAIELLGANSSFTQLNGLRINEGSLTIGDHTFTSTSLYNTGTLSVAAGGTIDIAKSKNLSGGTLTGGTWVVDGTGAQAAKLIVGSGNITTNDATIELIGAGSSFAQLNGLKTNEGALIVASGASLGLGGKIDLYNTGTLTVASGGTVDITASKNLSGGASGAKGSVGATLTGGTWVVDSTGGQAAKLTVGSRIITTNDANIELLGANSSFAQLSGLESNEGELTIGAGASFTTARLANTGTLVTGAGGTLIDSGKLVNSGWITDGGSITVSGSIDGTGTLDNTGTLTVAPGGYVDITSSKNLSGGISGSKGSSGETLTGGTWVVDSTGESKTKVATGATLIIGNGNITTNDATIELLGASSSFAQLNGLRVNEGSLTIGSGARLDSKLSLYNTGTLTVASGSSVDIAASRNLSGGISGSKGSSGETLTGGTWVVDSTGGQAAELTVGSGNITTNDATIELLGASSSFAQLNGLKTNEGSLTIGSGAAFTTAGLVNTGTLVSGSGGALVVDGKLINKGSITVAGTITRGDTATGKVTTGGEASLTNSGKLAITSGGGVTGLTNFTQTSGVTTLSGGVLSAQSVNFAGGVLTGSGTVDPASPIQIGPGSIVQPTGTLTLQGSTEFDGELAIGIAGPDDFGDLDELGAIDFGASSSIDFSFDPGFDMVAPSYQFQFLEASNDITGLQNPTFAYDGLGDYTPQEILDCSGGGCDYSLLLTRNANSVPEPGTLPLAALGVLGLSFSAALRRRKQRRS